MIIDKKTMSMIGIMLLAFWLSFIFLDWSFANKTQVVEPVIQQQEMPGTLVDQSTISNNNSSLTHSSASENPMILTSSGFDEGMQDIWQRQSSLQDIRVLVSAYDKNPDQTVLVSLIQRLAANYQFDDANRYLQKLMQQAGYERLLDANVILYILLHSDTIALDSDTSIDTIMPLVIQWRSEGLLTKDDESFYQWLSAIRKKQYSVAQQSRSAFTTPRYISIAQSYQKALNEFSWSRDVPAYYQDALVSLSMLKNWYFSVAKKLALGTLMKNEEYVLPYQILAYANFLSTNWDVAAQYFLKLADFDKANSARYTFLVGVSYYRQGEYDQSLLYINQVTDTGLLTDVYRYEILSYIATNDMNNATRVRQKLLWQSDLQASDFALFFDMMFYEPYANGQPFTLARDNSQLVTFYTDSCDRLFSWTADVCTYGEVWQDLSNVTWTWIADKLLYLSTVYHQAPISHVLGDYYLQHKDYDLAQQAYTDALSLAPSSNEKILLQTNMQKALDAAK